MLHSELQELLTLTNQYLVQASKKHKKIVISQESYKHFQSTPTLTPAPHQTPPPAPQKISTPPPEFRPQYAQPKPLPKPPERPQAPQEIPKEPATPFTTEKLPPAASQDFSDIRTIVAKNYPNIKLTERTPLPHELVKPNAAPKALVIAGAARTAEEKEFIGKIGAYLKSGGIITTLIDTTNPNIPKLGPTHEGLPVLQLGEVARFLTDQSLKVKLRNYLKTHYPNLP